MRPWRKLHWAPQQESSTSAWTHCTRSTRLVLTAFMKSPHNLSSKPEPRTPPATENTWSPRARPPSHAPHVLPPSPASSVLQLSPSVWGWKTIWERNKHRFGKGCYWFEARCKTYWYSEGVKVRRKKNIRAPSLDGKRHFSNSWCRGKMRDRLKKGTGRKSRKTKSRNRRNTFWK